VLRTYLLIAAGRTYWDAKLTEKGEQQCADLKEAIKARPHPLDVECVIVSPLTRTLQTAYLSLGAAEEEGAPPFIANEMCRERIADFTCGRVYCTVAATDIPLHYSTNRRLN
jgi:broad specificity phosphatase PhoE